MLINSDEIQNYLKIQGAKILSINPTDKLFFPVENESIDECYRIMKKYTFRLFLKEAIKRKYGFKIDEVCKYIGKHSALIYIRFLQKAGLISFRKKDEKYFVLNPLIRNLGDTFEWFVSEIFKREFNLQSAYGLKVRGFKISGDLDVLVRLEGNLIYSEVKTCPPRNVEINNISAFLDRIKRLNPSMALFIEDTGLRMSDKIIPLFRDALLKRAKEKKLKTPEFEVTKLQNETYKINTGLYITNSTPEIVKNISLCVRDFLNIPKISWIM